MEDLESEIINLIKRVSITSGYTYIELNKFFARYLNNILKLYDNKDIQYTRSLVLRPVFRPVREESEDLGFSRTRR